MQKIASPLLAGTSISALAAQDIHQKVRQAATLAVPAHLMVLMIEWAVRKGYGVRVDVMDRLNNAAGMPLIGLDELSISRAAKLTDETASKVLHELSPDDPRDGLAAVAMLYMVMIDEGLWADVKNMGVLVALLMLEDMKAEGGEWSFREAPLQRKAKELLLLLQREGFYRTRVVEAVATTSAELQA